MVASQHIFHARKCSSLEALQEPQVQKLWIWSCGVVWVRSTGVPIALYGLIVEVCEVGHFVLDIVVHFIKSYLQNGAFMQRSI